MIWIFAILKKKLFTLIDPDICCFVELRAMILAGEQPWPRCRRTRMMFPEYSWKN